MKTYSYAKDMIMVIGLAVILTIFITKPVHSQDPLKKEPKTTINLKIVKDDNGKTTVIDTTFTTNDSFDSDELHEMMGNLGDEMAGMGDDLKEWNFNINEMELPDSAMKDSLKKIRQKVIVLSKNFKSPHFKWNKTPHAYNYQYDFDVPCPPAPPMPPDCREFQGNFDWDGDQGAFFRSNKSRGETLSDILGDIPMDRIKNYSIKERKGGKRIVIDVEDAPLISHPEERVIVIRKHEKE
jgi:hypothetical protein